MADIAGPLHTLCPQCGPRVAIDEDGLCVSCGATAIGDGVDAMYALLDEAAAALRACVESSEWWGGTKVQAHARYPLVSASNGKCICNACISDERVRAVLSKIEGRP